MHPLAPLSCCAECTPHPSQSPQLPCVVRISHGSCVAQKRPARMMRGVRAVSRALATPFSRDCDNCLPACLPAYLPTCLPLLCHASQLTYVLWLNIEYFVDEVKEYSHRRHGPPVVPLWSPYGPPMALLWPPRHHVWKGTRYPDNCTSSLRKTT